MCPNNNDFEIHKISSLFFSLCCFRLFYILVLLVCCRSRYFNRAQTTVVVSVWKLSTCCHFSWWWWWSGGDWRFMLNWIKNVGHSIITTAMSKSDIQKMKEIFKYAWSERRRRRIRIERKLYFAVTRLLSDHR